MILAGDVGGTKSSLGLFEQQGQSLRKIFQYRLGTRDFGGFEPLVEAFFKQVAHAGVGVTTLDAAAFGVAGVVIDGRHYSENLPWLVDVASLQKKLNLKTVGLLNDLVATASSLERLPAEDFVVLNSGKAGRNGTRGVIAAGTGLGSAILFWDGGKYQVKNAETGMTDFAPRNAREIEFLAHLQSHLPHVCCDEILSGRGFRRIHEFLNSSVGHESFEGGGGNAAAEITQRGMDGSCAVCAETLNFWIEVFGSTTSNFALQTMATGGVYLGGGIAVKILAKLKDGAFFKAFCGSGKLQPVLANVPVSVILNEDAPMWGAAYHALDSLTAASAMG